MPSDRVGVGGAYAVGWPARVLPAGWDTEQRSWQVPGKHIDFRGPAGSNIDVQGRSKEDKDRRDVEVTLPLLDPNARRWLRDAVARMDPEREWVRTL